MISEPMEIGLTSDDLLRRARAGDADAQMALLSPYWGRVSRLTFRVTGHEQDAQDLAQEAFIRMVRQLPSYRGECALGMWVFRVALNVCLTARARRREEAVNAEAWPIRDPAPGPEARALGRELQARVRDEIRRLPPACRSAVLLRLIDERSYEEIAAVLEIPIATARVQVHRGLKQLRKRLGPWLGREERP